MKIGEVALIAGITNRAIRHYEELNLIKSRRLSIIIGNIVRRI